jgi:hypothetical protein
MLGSYLAMADRVSIPWDVSDFRTYGGWSPEGNKIPMFGSLGYTQNDGVEIRETITEMIVKRYGEEATGVLELVEDFCDNVDFETFEGFTLTSGFAGLAVFRDRDYGKPKNVSIKVSTTNAKIMALGPDYSVLLPDDPIFHSTDESSCEDEYSESSDSEDFDTSTEIEGGIADMLVEPEDYGFLEEDIARPRLLLTYTMPAFTGESSDSEMDTTD